MRTSDKRFAVTLLCGVAVAMAGCARLPQASLVYASSQQMGVSVKAGTPEKPGLDLTIGYSGLNAASVPVVVAIGCERLSEAQCSMLRANVGPIAGQSSTADLRTGIELERTNLRARGQSLDSEILARQIEINTAAGAVSELEALPGQREELVSLVAVDEPSPKQVARRTELEQIVERLGRASLTAAQRRLAELTSAKSILERQLGEVNDRLRAINNQRETAENENRADAMSVYGSFNGQAGGGNSSGSLAVGQVFSTGIASQNLTQGIRESAGLRASFECLRGLDEVARAVPSDAQNRSEVVAGILASAGRVCVHLPTDPAR